MLSQFKKEEDTNFKSKFDQLINVEEYRHKIRESIISVKNSFNLKIDTSQISKHKKLVRVGSQPSINRRAQNMLGTAGGT